MSAAYEIRYTNDATKSLLTIDPSSLVDVTSVLRQLDTYLDKYPSRTRPKDDGTYVYYHPNPPFPDIEISYTLDKEHGIVECVHIAAPSMRRLVAFVSYSHEDRTFVEKEFEPYMKTLEDQNLIKFWKDSEIESGTRWNEEIQEKLQSAKLAVLLVTPYFLSSDYIKDNELDAIKKRYDAGEISVQWIHVSSCLYKGYWFARIQALADPKVPLDVLRKPKRRQQLTAICEELTRRLFEQTKAQPPPA